MSKLVAELLGTAVLILLGDGVVANVVLAKTKGHNAGWIVITAGWGLAVFVGVLIAGDVSGAHLNPAVSIGLAAAANSSFGWADVPGYVAAQFAGAMIGAGLVFAMHRSHFAETASAGDKLGVFCNAPAIRNVRENLIGEILGTCVLILAVLYMAKADPGLGAVRALPIGLVVFAIGLSLGGTTGYAINPARDLGPRIMHALLPIPGKGDSDWGYSWIPVVGPILGALLAVAVYWVCGPRMPAP